MANRGTVSLEEWQVLIWGQVHSVWLFSHVFFGMDLCT